MNLLQKVKNTTLKRSNKKENRTPIQESEQRYKSLIERLPAAIYTTDETGIITLYNEAAVEFWGRRPEIGKELWCGSFKIFELDGITEIPLDKCPMAVALKEKSKVVVTEPFIVERPDGVRKYFIPHPEPIFDFEGNMIGATNMLLDVTQSKLAEEQGARLAAIIKSSSDAIISKNLDSIITSWNDAAETLFGYKAEEMIGESILKLFPKERLNEEAYILNEIKKGELVKHYETKRIRKNGTFVDVSVTVSAIRNAKGNIIGASKIARDITDIKKIEQRKDDFIKMASHELKTPITSINGYVQLLLNIYNDSTKEDEKSRPVIKASLQTISRQVAKLTRLISELLDLSKIESGRLQLDKTEFCLEELIEEAVQEARQTTTRHAIIFRSDYDGKIIADRDRIGQVMTNLLSNAIKYSPDADKVEMLLKANGKFVTIQIKDHGIGIDKKDQLKIFERFYRVEGKDELTFPGFGIGLFITSEIVQRHEGTVTLESEKNNGSVFTVRLPIQTNGIKTR
jgi:PAS domain S-box-containing protein